MCFVTEHHRILPRTNPPICHSSHKCYMLMPLELGRSRGKFKRNAHSLLRPSFRLDGGCDGPKQNRSLTTFIRTLARLGTVQVCLVMVKQRPKATYCTTVRGLMTEEASFNNLMSQRTHLKHPRLTPFAHSQSPNNLTFTHSRSLKTPIPRRPQRRVWPVSLREVPTHQPGVSMHVK